MRIGLNATCFDDRPSGANQRFRALYGAVIRRNPQHVFVVYEPAGCRVADWFGDCPNVVARRTPLPGAGRLARMIAGARYWPGALSRESLDVFECFSLPLVRAPCRTLLTIHDLRPIGAGLKLPHRLAGAMVLRHAFARADRVIAVSDAIRAEILAFRPATRVVTIYNGVDPAGFGVSPGEWRAVGDRLGLPGDFALAVGHLEARKNLPLLIDAVALLRDRGVDRPLAIVGNDGGERAALQARIAARGVGGLVTLIAGADDAAVRALYAACRLVAVPSRYEGFGIALIEAMAAGRPLVTSDIAVFRELTQDRGRYFGVDDVAAAAAAIDRVWTDEAERARLIGHGRARAGDFCFDRLADQVAALYAG